MENIDGGLHPAVDGQSLDEDEDEVQKVPKTTPQTPCSNSGGTYGTHGTPCGCSDRLQLLSPPPAQPLPGS